jgi:F0F1-type ATP synthase membrane subunit b/b'
MRFRLGFVTGMATGYYLGAKAGRQRYDQINRTIAKIKRSEAYEEVTEMAKAKVEEAAEKAKTAVEEGVEKAREVVESRGNPGSTGDNANGHSSEVTDLGGYSSSR